MQPQNAAGRITGPTVWVPKGKWHHEISDRSGGAAGGTTGRVLRIVRICRLSPWKSTGKLSRHRLAQQHPAGRAAQPHTGGVCRGAIAFVDRGSVLRGQVGRVHNVLGSEWNAVNRTAARAPVAFPGLRQGKIVVQMDPRVDL